MKADRPEASISMKERKIAKVIKKTRLGEDEGSDLEYWLSRSPAERIAALEEIRAEYNNLEIHGC